VAGQVGSMWLKEELLHGWLENLKQEYHLEDRDVEGRIRVEHKMSPFLISSLSVSRALSGVLLRQHDESLRTGRVGLL
jgi:hypothetical protein